MNQNNQIKDKNKNELINYKKENYDIDSPESNINLTNKNNKDNNEDNNKFELFNENKIKNEEEKVRKNEEFIIFPNIKEEEEEENKINRFSNLKDIELPLEDKIQIQNQVDNDNDNESEQIEVIENILNNFEKEKYKNNKFLEYKNKNKKIKKKSQSVTKSKNNILNKIKHDIAIINFEQEINKICNNHNHNLILKGEKLNINIINNNHINYNNKSKGKNNMLRIEEIRKKLFSGNDIFSKSKSITNHKKNENKIFFNKKNNEDNFYNSCNNFYNTTKQKSKVNNILFNDINNIKEIKINNYNFNRIYNNFYDTFRNKITDIDKENKVIMPFNTIMGNKNHLKTDESPTRNSFYNSNQFFFNVFKNSIKEYPYLHLLTKKVNKMKCNDFSKNKLNNKKSMDIIENKDKDKDNEQKISILEKINRQKDIFQKEIDKYKRK